MVNLDIILDETIDFTLNGETIKVRQPSVSVIKKVNKFQVEVAGKSDIDLIFNTQTEVITEILNNNTSGKKFTVKQVEALPQKVQNVIIETVLNDIIKADNDPN